MKITRRPKLPVTKPGIYRDIPIEVYHSAALCGDQPSVSSSGLRTLWEKSPAHFFHSSTRLNPQAVPFERTKWMLLGSAAHHLLLGEAHFSTLFVARPDTIRDADGDLVPWHHAKSICKKWVQDQEKAGRIIVTLDMLEKIRGMGRALAAAPVAADLLTGEVECTMVAKDPETGLWLCARPDAIPAASGDFADLKTIGDISDLGVSLAIANGALHMQGALLWEVCELLGVEFESFNLVFVESEPPHCVRVVPIHDDDLALGRRQNRAALRAIRACLDAGRWPGPSEEMRTTRLPERARTYIEHRLAQCATEGRLT